MPTGHRYEIRSIVDLLKVPKGRREQCLTELEGWLAHVEADVVRRAPQSMGPFIWTDDGIGGVRTEARYLERDALVVGPGYLDRNPNDSQRRFRDMSVREQHARVR